MKEIWKPIKGFEGIYEVSNYGNVKSLKRKGVCKKRILKLTIDNQGYVYATLSNKKGKLYSIARLLYSHFKGDLINGLVIDHIDNNKLNNSLDNLQQITKRENATKDRWRINTSSSYLGVCWCDKKNKWRSTIWINKKQKHIGYYKSEIKASKAYRKELLKEIKHYETKMEKQALL